MKLVKGSASNCTQLALTLANKPTLAASNAGKHAALNKTIVDCITGTCISIIYTLIVFLLL